MSVLSCVQQDFARVGLQTPVGEVAAWAPKFIEKAKIQTVRDTSTVQSIRFETLGAPNIPITQFQVKKKRWEGDFGILYEILRITPNGIVEPYFLKREPKKGQLKKEALIQILVGGILRAYGFEYAVPRVRDVFLHPKWGTIFTMTPIQNASVLSEFLETRMIWGQPSSSNDRWILSILAQIALYLAIIHKEIGFDHRDLKDSNIMLVAPSELQTYKIQLGDKEITIRAQCRAILIDYGFACIGDPLTRKNLVSAGEYLPRYDFCPKVGRDLFLLVASLVIDVRFRNSMTPQCLALFRRWIGSLRYDWICQSTDPVEAFETLYLVSLENIFSRGAATPLAVLIDLAHSVPHIVSIKKASVEIKKGEGAVV